MWNRPRPRLIPVQGPQLLGAEILLFTTGTLVLTIDAGVLMIRAAVPPYVTSADFRTTSWPQG